MYCTHLDTFGRFARKPVLTELLSVCSNHDAVLRCRMCCTGMSLAEAGARGSSAARASTTENLAERIVQVSFAGGLSEQVGCRNPLFSLTFSEGCTAA